MFVQKMHLWWYGILLCCGVQIYAEQTDSTQVQQVAEKPIVVIIPSYKNSKWYQKNLDSIVSQKYSDFKVIYIDDCSPDDTGQLVADYIADRHLENTVTLIRNTVRRGALANIYAAVHRCDDQAIIVTVDGDDWLKHDAVLARVNREYACNDAWLTYGHFELYPAGENKPQRVVQAGVMHHNCYREATWVTSHLRTFYAWLFKRIKLQDFLFEGTFFDVTWDMAFMFPMLEMSGKHACPITDTLYVYNADNPINDCKTKIIRQIYCDHLIRSMPRYTRLNQVPKQVYAPVQHAMQVLVFSQDTPQRVEPCLESLRTHVPMLTQISVLYQVSTPEAQAAYAQVQKKYSQVNWVCCTPHNFTQQLRALAQSGTTDYCLITHDGVVLTDSLDYAHCMHTLEQTHAYAFYCTLGQDMHSHPSLVRTCTLPPSVLLEHDMYAWQFKDGEQEWRTPHSFAMAVYRTADICSLLDQIQCADVQSLQSVCDKMRFDMYAVGLYHKKAKAVSIDL